MYQTKSEKKWETDEHYLGERDSENFKTGNGENHWISAEYMNFHVGKWLRDHMHGVGEYKWKFQGKNPELFATYEGTFFANHLDGYGTMSYADGKVFKGMYKMNTRFGPGVETRPNLKSNVGLWCGNQLIRLSWSPEGLPIVPNFSDDQSVVQIIEDRRPKFYPVKKPIIKDTSSESMHSYSTPHNNSPVSTEKLLLSTEDITLLDKKISASVDFTKCDAVYNEEVFAKAMFGKHWEELIDLEKSMQLNNLGRKQSLNLSVMTDVLYNAWNPTPELIAMMKHCYRYKSFNKRNADIDVKAIMSSERSRFHPPDTHELDCRALLLASFLGDINTVMHLVNSCNVNVDVMDSRGNTPLFYACCGDQHQVISFLLIAGADADRMNDDCVSVMSLAMMRYVAALNGGIPTNLFPSAFVPLSVTRHIDINIKPSEWMIARSGSNLNVSEKGDTKKNRKPSKTKLKQPQKKNAPPQQLDTVTETEETFGSDHIYSELYNLTRKHFMEDMQNEPLKYFKIDDLLMKLDINNINKTSVMDRFHSKAMVVERDPDGKIEATERIVFQLLPESNSKLCKFPLPALAWAIVSKDVNLVSSLIDRGEPINQCFFQLSNLTPILIAIAEPYTKQSLDIIDYLLTVGANPNQRQSIYYPKKQSTEMLDGFLNLIGPGLLHLIVMMKPKNNCEAQIQKTLIKKFLDSGTDPAMLYLEHSVIDIVLHKDLNLLETFLSHPAVDPNLFIDGNDETIVGKMFTYDFFKSKEGKHILDALNIALKYGADPLAAQNIKDDSYENVFIFARMEYEKIFCKELNTEWKPQPPPVKTVDDLKGSRKSLKLSKISLGGDHYVELYATAAKVGRELLARRIRGKLLLRIAKLCLKCEFQHWSLIVPEVTNRRAIISWLSTQYVMNIWDALAKKHHYLNKPKILHNLLCIVCYFQRMGDVNEKVTNDTKPFVEKDATEYKKRYEKSKQDFGEQKHYIMPELDENASKYNVCYDCFTPLGDSPIVCKLCNVVKFCSSNCMQRCSLRHNVHICAKVFKTSPS